MNADLQNGRAAAGPVDTAALPPVRLSGDKLTFALERLWGWATNKALKKFGNFGEVHIVPPEKIPPLKEMTIWWWADPHGQRNWFMLWTGVDAQGVKWTFKEWPDIEMGEWALPGQKPDGREGPAQTAGGGVGFDFYKRLILELEGWRQTAEGKWEIGDGFPVFDRQIDPRPAGTSVPSDSDNKTYLQYLSDPLYGPNGERQFDGHDVRAGAHCGIKEGIGWVNDWINGGWDRNAPVTPLNCPKWYISSACVNTIWALRCYTGDDGDKGACKDPIDCLRGFSKTGIRYVAPGMLGSHGEVRGY